MTSAAAFEVSGDPSTSHKAAVQWLAEQRRRPIRAPHKIVEYGEVVISQGGLSSLPDEELWSILEQVGIAAIELARWDLAELCIARVQSRFPASQRVASLQGMLLEGKGELSKALAFYDAQLEEDNTSLVLSRRRIAAIKSLGTSHPRGGPKKAIEALNLHLDIFYQDPEAWQELAELYADEGLYQQSAFALEEVLLQVPQNSFFHLKYAETLYTAGDVGKAYKAYLRVLEMCQSDKGSGSSSTQNIGGPFARALWGTKVTTSALLANTSLLRSSENSGAEDLDVSKVKKIDALVTSLLLNKVYAPSASSEASKPLRDAVRAVLSA
ncbi:TPR-like protein [Testicularia cyperi]|uniref:ER membrane protein complex subunit 2 n=1 Tax=Testicularia cyperi TaxID=1882483 RepID=A0A317Y0D0_9BASI|nr:TPR-like protein [Testicularia cyperi]